MAFMGKIMSEISSKKARKNQIPKLVSLGSSHRTCVLAMNEFRLETEGRARDYARTIINDYGWVSIVPPPSHLSSARTCVLAMNEFRLESEAQAKAYARKIKSKYDWVSLVAPPSPPPVGS